MQVEGYIFLGWIEARISCKDPEISPVKVNWDKISHNPITWVKLFLCWMDERPVCNMSISEDNNEPIFTLYQDAVCRVDSVGAALFHLY